MSIKGDLIAVGIAGAVLLAAGWYAKKKLEDAAGAVRDTVAHAWDQGAQAVAELAPVIDKTLSWPILTAGDAVGIPRTDMTACEKAIAANNKWDASFACPAGKFLGFVF